MTVNARPASMARIVRTVYRVHCALRTSIAPEIQRAPRVEITPTHDQEAHPKRNAYATAGTKTTKTVYARYAPSTRGVLRVISTIAPHTRIRLVEVTN